MLWPAAAPCQLVCPQIRWHHKLVEKKLEGCRCCPVFEWTPEWWRDRKREICIVSVVANSDRRLRVELASVTDNPQSNCRVNARLRHNWTLFALRQGPINGRLVSQSERSPRGMRFFLYLDIYLSRVIPLILWYQGFPLQDIPSRGAPTAGAQGMSKQGNKSTFHSQYEIILEKPSASGGSKAERKQFPVKRGNNNLIWCGSGAYERQRQCITNQNSVYLCCGKVGPICHLYRHVVHRLHLRIKGLGHD